MRKNFPPRLNREFHPDLERMIAALRLVLEMNQTTQTEPVKDDERKEQRPAA